MNGGKGDLPSHSDIPHASCKTFSHSRGYHIDFFRQKSKWEFQMTLNTIMVFNFQTLS